MMKKDQYTICQKQKNMRTILRMLHFITLMLAILFYIVIFVDDRILFFKTLVFLGKRKYDENNVL